MALPAFLLNCEMKVESHFINSFISHVNYLLYFSSSAHLLSFLCFLISLSFWSRPCQFATVHKQILPTFYCMYSAWRTSYRVWLDNTYYNTAFLIQMNLDLGFTACVKSCHLYLAAMPLSLEPTFTGIAKGSVSPSENVNTVNKHPVLLLWTCFLRILLAMIQ